MADRIPRGAAGRDRALLRAPLLRNVHQAELHEGFTNEEEGAGDQDAFGVGLSFFQGDGEGVGGFARRVGGGADDFFELDGSERARAAHRHTENAFHDLSQRRTEAGDIFVSEDPKDESRTIVRAKLLVPRLHQLCSSRGIVRAVENDAIVLHSLETSGPLNFGHGVSDRFWVGTKSGRNQGSKGNGCIDTLMTPRKRKWPRVGDRFGNEMDRTTEFSGGAAKDRFHFGCLRSGDDRNTSLDDTRFLRGDGVERFTQVLRVIVADRGEDGNGGSNDVRRIKAPAEAGLKDDPFGALLLKPDEREGGRDFKEGGLVRPLGGELTN